MNAYQSSQYDQMLCNAYDDMTVLVFKTPGVLQIAKWAVELMREALSFAPRKAIKS